MRCVILLAVGCASDPDPSSSEPEPEPEPERVDKPAIREGLAGPSTPPGALYAAPGSMVWAKTAGGADYDAATTIAADGTNTVVAGYFSGTTDLGCGPMTSVGSYDLFVAKYTPTGTCVWSRRAGGAGATVGAGIAVGADSAVYVTGDFGPTATFGATQLTSAGGRDGFLAKLDADGNSLWASRYGGGGDDYSYGVAVDGAAAWTTGAFEGSATFGAAQLTSAGGTDVFVALFSAADGSSSSARRYGGPGQDVGNALALAESSRVVVAGAFAETVDFGGGGLTAPGGGYDAFMAKYDANGTHVLSRRYGSAGTDSATSVAVDASGQIVLGGYFQTSIDLGGGALGGAGEYSGFVASYTAGAGHRWSHRVDATSAQVQGVATDAASNVVLTGTYSGAADFQGGSATAVGAADIYVVKYGASGAYAWSRSSGGVGSAGGVSVGATSSGYVAVAGYFGSSVDLGAGPVTGAGANDIAVYTLEP